MLTRVVIIRHAKPCSEGYPDDTLRPLSDKGKVTQLMMTNKLKDMGLTPNFILTSPFVRAMQTAEIISHAYGDVPVIPDNSLGDSYDSQKIISQIPSPENNNTIFIVGHAPTLSRLIFEMVGNFNSIHELATSSATIIDFRDPPAPGKGLFSGYISP